MRLFRYNAPDEFSPVEITEEEIIQSYFPYWSEQMKKVNKESEINHENCIQDFIVVHWAWEVKDAQ